MSASAHDACLTDLFTEKTELVEKYGADTAAKVIRIREAYTAWLDDPSMKARQIAVMIMERHRVSGPTAYSDLAVVKALLPKLGEAARDFHRWRYNEMILETYNAAKANGDFRTMERAATSYAKNNRVDEQEERALPWEVIAVQPFVATSDPRVLGIEPIPNLRERQRELIAELSRDIPDIIDVEAEDADLDVVLSIPSIPDNDTTGPTDIF